MVPWMRALAAGVKMSFLHILHKSGKQKYSGFCLNAHGHALGIGQYIKSGEECYWRNINKLLRIKWLN